MTWPHDLVPGLDVREGERWADAAGCPGYAVSTEGRIVRLPADILTGNGRRRIPGRLLATLAKYPRLAALGRARSARGSMLRADLGRVVLETFARPARGREIAERINGVSFDCRLVNLRWSTDRLADIVDRFLADNQTRRPGDDLELAAMRLDVSRSVLASLLTAERRRLGVPAKPGRRTVYQIAQEIRAARDLSPAPAMVPG